jgi:hypothetical protein
MANDTGGPRPGRLPAVSAGPGQGGKLKKGKAGRMIDTLLDNARFDYQVRYEAIRNLEEIDRMLDDPLLVNNKETAADICRILIKMLVGEGVMKEGSIMYRLALRLLDYILKTGEETAEKNGTKTREKES